MRHHQILIIGGGNAGISIASQLYRKNRNLDIAIVDPADKHYYQPAWTLVGGGAFDVAKTVRPQEEVMPSHVKWIQAGCTGFSPDENKVTLSDGDQVTYDQLVVCPGIQLNWDKVKGLRSAIENRQGVSSNYRFEWAPQTWDLIRNFSGKGKALFTAPNTPIKCGGAPQKIMYLAADYFRKSGLLKHDSFHFYSGGTVIFGVPEFAKTLNEVIKRYDIETHFGHNLVEVRGEEKIAVFETEVFDHHAHQAKLERMGCVVVDTSHDGRMVQVGVPFEIMHATPPQSAPDFIRDSPLAVPGNGFGWLDINKHTLQHNRYANIWGAGDATSTPNAKTGAAIRKQAPVLVENLLATMENKQGNGNYTGYGSCPLVTGYHKLVLAEFDYENKPMTSFPFDQTKERYSMWLLKKNLLPYLYWNKILKGTA